MRACLVALLAAILVAAGPLALAQDATPASPVRVFDAGELTLDRYTVVKRLWTGTWRSAFWVPTENDPAAAIAALTSEAAGLGADAVVNLHCVNDAGAWGGGHYCYGLAIKLK